MNAPSRAPVALVTGGAVRVGRAIAMRLIDAGYRVWVHHHASTDAVRTLPVRVSEDPDAPGVVGTPRADLRVGADRARLIDEVLDPEGRCAGRLDLLVNNAAGFEAGRFLERTDDDLQRVLTLNLVAPLALVRGFAPALAPGGSVVNLLDLGAHHPWVGRVDHCVAKAGLWSATRALAAELAPIRVNAVSPGTVAWPPGQGLSDPRRRRAAIARIPRGRIGTPEDVAEAVLTMARSLHVTGQTLVVDGGQSAALGGVHGVTDG